MHPRAPLFLLTLLFTLPLLSRAASADRIKDAELGLTLPIPAGFEPAPDIVELEPGIKHAYRRRAATEGEFDTLILVERLRGVLGRERLDRSHMPATFKGRLFTMEWTAFEVDAFEIFETFEGADTVTYNVQVPLTPKAIQLRIFGPRAQAAELEGLTRSLLDSLEGRTNWIMSVVLPERMSGAAWYRWVLIAVMIGVLAGGLLGVIVLTRRRSRRAALLVCLLCVVVGRGCERSISQGYRTREGMVVSSSLVLLGFVGAATAVAVRRRKKQPALTHAAVAG